MEEEAAVAGKVSRLAPESFSFGPSLSEAPKAGPSMTNPRVL